jgi:hypothetical protein
LQPSTRKQWGFFIAKLAQCQFPTCGSIQSDEHGEVEVHQWNSMWNIDCAPEDNEHVPRGPFSSTADYLLAQATTQRVFREYNMKLDGHIEISLAESLLPHFVDRTYLNGPFVLYHIDLDIQNILVDPEQRVITGIIDWDFPSTVPVQSLFVVPVRLRFGETQSERALGMLYAEDLERAIVSSVKELGLDLDVQRLVEIGRVFGLYEKALAHKHFRTHLPAL